MIANSDPLKLRLSLTFADKDLNPPLPPLAVFGSDWLVAIPLGGGLLYNGTPLPPASLA